MSAYDKQSQFNEKRKFMEEGLFISSLRGRDGTGLALVHDDKQQPWMYKRSVASPDFLQLKATERLLYRVDAAAVAMGHTRAGTKGFIDDANTHPFQYGHITLTHNGTLHNHKTLCKEIDVEVDSAHIAAGIAERGEKETLEAMRGDYCVIWHNAQDGTFNVARNKGRPLYWIKVPEWKGIIYASEYSMLGWLIDRQGIKTEGKFQFPKEHVHYKFKLDAKELEFSADPFKEPPQWSTQAHRGGNGNKTTGGHTGQGSNTATRNTGTGTATNIDEEITKFYEKYKTAKGNSGRATSKKGIAKSIAALDKLNLRYDVSYTAEPQNFILYKNQRKLGFVLCSLKGHQHGGRRAEMHNIKKEVWDVMNSSGYLIGKAIGVKNYKADRVVVLELDDRYLQYVMPVPRQADDADKPEDADKKYMGPSGVSIGIKAFTELTEDGCCGCGGNCLPEDSKQMLWVGQYGDQPLCVECSTNTQKLNDLGVTQQ